MDVKKCVNLLGIEWFNDAIDYTNHANKWYSGLFFGEISMIYLLSQGRKSKICNSVYIYRLSTATLLLYSYIVGWPALAQSVERWVFKLKGAEFESSYDPVSKSSKQPSYMRLVHQVIYHNSMIFCW